MELKGYELLARSLVRQKVKTGFFLMGAPMTEVTRACVAGGIRLIDVRHEQAAAMMAHAYARVLARPGVCMAASGPGTINFTTGLANALVDCAPIVALGGASPLALRGMGAFQEIDQVAIMRPVTKWSESFNDVKRIPELVDIAFGQAMSGRPGPVYLDLPGDVLHQAVPEEQIRWPAEKDETALRPQTTRGTVKAVIERLSRAERPLVISGSGILWSGASEELRRFVELTGIPFYTTPQGRGVIPDDHPLSYLHARSTAMKEADLVVVVGTRLNHVFGFGRPPRFSAAAKLIQIDIDPAEIIRNTHLHLGIVGDARAVLVQLCQEIQENNLSNRFESWRKHLETIARDRYMKSEDKLTTSQVPIHPLRLCKEIRDFMSRDAILIVDGQEILNFGRQSIPTFMAGHRLNSGPFGTMGVGLPFGLGAKAAKPEAQVIVLHGDGSFGLNAMELDTAIRHKLPVLIVISLNGGWTADPDRSKPGRDLGYTRFDKMAETLGCHGEYVEKPGDIYPALQRAAKAVAAGQTALVNVVTDWRARAATTGFTAYVT